MYFWGSYLLFHWVNVPHLASHILGQLAKRVAGDWEQRWGYRPVLMETFIDTTYKGTCYRAAGWQELGMTTGEGAYRPGSQYTTSPKHILVKPLHRQYQLLLTSEQLQGRIIQWKKWAAAQTVKPSKSRKRKKKSRDRVAKTSIGGRSNTTPHS